MPAKPHGSHASDTSSRAQREGMRIPGQRLEEDITAERGAAPRVCVNSRNPPRSEGSPTRAALGRPRTAAAPPGSRRHGLTLHGLGTAGPGRTAPPPRSRFSPLRKQPALPRQSRTGRPGAPAGAAGSGGRAEPAPPGPPRAAPPPPAGAELLAGAHLLRRRSPAPPARRTSAPPPPSPRCTAGPTQLRRPAPLPGPARPARGRGNAGRGVRPQHACASTAAPWEL